MTVSTSVGATTVRDGLLEALRDVANFNSADVVAPMALLWPDAERAWERALRPLSADIPILTLGGMSPGDRKGPAAWLRIETERLVRDEPLQQPPVIYLPGIGRKHLVDFSALQDHEQPLAGLVVRSAIFAQRSGADWTPSAFLSNEAVGMGLSVSASRGTKDALARSLARLLDVRLSELQGRILDSTDFDALLVDDPARQLLRWLSDPVGYRGDMEVEGSWTGFVSLVRKQFKLDLVRDGDIVAAQQLGDRQGKWAEVWGRFADAPHAYPGVVDALRRCRHDGGQLPLHPDSWPQDNEQAEAQTFVAVANLAGQPVGQITRRIGELRQAHEQRLSTVWATLGLTPGAILVRRLADLAEQTASLGAGDSVASRADQYARTGWHADRAFMSALAAVELGDPAASAVQKVAEAMYRPWLEATVAAFQTAWLASPPVGPSAGIAPHDSDGTCVLFVDGLRFDVAAQLVGALTDRGLATDLGWGFAAVPTVTGTCKPAVSPVAGVLIGGPGLSPGAPDGPAVTQEVLKKLLAGEGWTYLSDDGVGDQTGKAWTEGGDVDALGHNLGGKLAHHLPEQVRGLSNRVAELLNAGWARVVVVTDHGWLLMPSGLPKHHLPEHLTVVRKGRCARLSPMVDPPPGIGLLPWRWDRTVSIALAPGIHAFEAGKSYEHGGLSPQESVVPILVATKPGKLSTSSLAIDLSWSGLRLKVEINNAPEGCSADLRTKAADPATSLVRAVKIVRGNKATLMASDDHAGVAAILVVIGPEGTVLANRPTQIPEG